MEYRPMSSIPSPRIPSDIQAALANANTIYLKATPIANLTPATKAAVPAALSATTSDPAVQNACVDLSNARLYLMRLSTLFRTGISLGQAWMNALGDMPGSDASGDLSKACNDIVDTIKRSPLPHPDATALVDAYVHDWVAGALESQLKNFETAYKDAPLNTDVAEVESRMVTLRGLLPKL